MNSLIESLTQEVIDHALGATTQVPIVNFGLTYKVNTRLASKGFTNYSFVVYHSGPNPHHTLNTHKEGQASAEMLDISREQAEGLNTGSITYWELKQSLKKPLPTFVPMGAQIVRIDG